jgi:hypothetical protein
MSLPLFRDSCRPQKKGREICSLPCRLSTRADARSLYKRSRRITLQHGPILRTRAAILTQSCSFFLSGGRFFVVKMDGFSFDKNMWVTLGHFGPPLLNLIIGDVPKEVNLSHCFMSHFLGSAQTNFNLLAVIQR